jgi:hypothetical protein
MQEIVTDGQGSPLAITEVEVPSYHDSSVELRMHVANRGQGKVITATIAEARLGDKALNCEFRGTRTKTFDFIGRGVQETDIICRRTLNIPRAVTSPLFVALDFTYEQELIDEILIRE